MSGRRRSWSARSPTTRGSSRSGRASATYFAERGVPTDYVLYSNYERLVDALLAGEVDIAWNTNTAYVAAEERIGGDAQVLGMRDVDADFRTVIVTRRGETFDSPADARRASGSRSAAATPATPRSCRCTTSRGEGLDAERGRRSSASTPISASTATPATPSFGSSARSRTARPTPARSATPTWAAHASGGLRGRRPSSRSPGGARPTTTATSPRCPRFDRGRAQRWSEALLAMELRRPGAAERDGSRGGQALAAGRQVGLRRPDRGDARAGVSVLSVHRVDAGTLELGGGPRDAGPRRARERPGRAASSRWRPRRARVAFELPAWARVAGHEHAGERSRDGRGSARSSCASARRRPSPGPRASASAARRPRSPRTLARSHIDDLRRAASRCPTHADPAAGLVAARRDRRSRAARAYAWRLNERDRALGRRARDAHRAGGRGAVGRHARHPVGGGRRAAGPRRAGGRPGDDLHRPERVRGALRAGTLPAAGEPALRRGPALARKPRPRRGAARRGVHEARARRRCARLRARLDRALAPHAARRDATSRPRRCC